jgi:hypothetical protein
VCSEFFFSFSTSHILILYSFFPINDEGKTFEKKTKENIKRFFKAILEKNAYLKVALVILKYLPLYLHYANSQK